MTVDIRSKLQDAVRTPLHHCLPVPNWYGQGAIAFSPDGNTIAIAGGTNGLYLWNTKTGAPLRSFQKYPRVIQTAWFTSDGRSIVSFSPNDTVLRIVHLVDSGAEPVQAGWGANSANVPTDPGARLGSLSGIVNDPAGKAIVGAEISVFDGDKPDSPPIGHTSTNAAGRFLFQGLKARHIRVLAEKRGFASRIGYAHLTSWEAFVDFTLTAAASGSR